MKKSFAPLLLILLVGCGINTAPGEGEKIGQIVKVSRVGILYKTWEAEIVRGGLTGGSGTAGAAPFYFTIESEAMAKQAMEYMRNQTEVSLQYRSEGFFSQTRTESGGDFAKSITPK